MTPSGLTTRLYYTEVKKDPSSSASIPTIRYAPTALVGLTSSIRSTYTNSTHISITSAMNHFALKDRNGESRIG